MEAGPSNGLPRGSEVLVKEVPGKGLGQSKHEFTAPEVTLQRAYRKEQYLASLRTTRGKNLLVHVLAHVKF